MTKQQEADTIAMIKKEIDCKFRKTICVDCQTPCREYKQWLKKWRNPK